MRMMDMELLKRQEDWKITYTHALGETALSTRGPFVVGSFQTIEQTYAVGTRALGPGARLLIGRQLMSDYAPFQKNSDAWRMKRRKRHDDFLRANGVVVEK